MTNGCPDLRTRLVSCTRPFGSYRPGEPFRDYPFPPTEEDRRTIRRQLGLARWLVPAEPDSTEGGDRPKGVGTALSQPGGANG